MKKLSALIPAVVIAPWVVVPLIVVGGLWSSDAGPTSDFASGLVLALLAGVPAAYAGTLVVGLPAFFVLRRIRLLRSWTLCLVGGVVPLVLSWGSGAQFGTQLMLSACGAAVALVAWQIVPRPHFEGGPHEP